MMSCRCKKRAPGQHEKEATLASQGGTKTGLVHKLGAALSLFSSSLRRAESLSLISYQEMDNSNNLILLPKLLLLL